MFTLLAYRPDSSRNGYSSSSDFAFYEFDGYADTDAFEKLAALWTELEAQSCHLHQTDNEYTYTEFTLLVDGKADRAHLSPEQENVLNALAIRVSEGALARTDALRAEAKQKRDADTLYARLQTERAERAQLAQLRQKYPEE